MRRTDPLPFFRAKLRGGLLPERLYGRRGLDGQGGGSAWLSSETATLPRWRGPGGRPLRVAHLTTVDMSLALLLGTELAVDVEAGHRRRTASRRPGRYVPAVEALGVAHVPLPSLTRSWDPRRDVRGDPRAGRGAARGSTSTCCTPTTPRPA